MVVLLRHSLIARLYPMLFRYSKYKYGKIPGRNKADIIGG
jgi:hypothetical protein